MAVDHAIGQLRSGLLGKEAPMVVQGLVRFAWRKRHTAGFAFWALLPFWQMICVFSGVLKQIPVELHLQRSYFWWFIGVWGTAFSVGACPGCLGLALLGGFVSHGFLNTF